jgi:hypothetical protein
MIYRAKANKERILSSIRKTLVVMDAEHQTSKNARNEEGIFTLLSH